jgi:3-hydroxyisobutyrate dehydrogenase-like beta-hydroxyacid dehydrogenase
MEPVMELSYGFIGLGQMGYGMAQNLRMKTHQASRFIICELDEIRRNRFIEETKGVIEVVDTPAAVAEQSVSSLPDTMRFPRMQGAAGALIISLDHAH